MGEGNNINDTHINDNDFNGDDDSSKVRMKTNANKDNILHQSKLYSIHYTKRNTVIVVFYLQN